MGGDFDTSQFKDVKQRGIECKAWFEHLYRS